MKRLTKQDALIVTIALSAAQLLSELLEYGIDNDLFTAKTKQVAKNSVKILVEKTNQQYDKKDRITGERLLDYKDSAKEFTQLTSFIENAIKLNDKLLGLTHLKQECFLKDYNKLLSKYGIS